MKLNVRHLHGVNIFGFFWSNHLMATIPLVVLPEKTTEKKEAIQNGRVEFLKFLKTDKLVCWYTVCKPRARRNNKMQVAAVQPMFSDKEL